MSLVSLFYYHIFRLNLLKSLILVEIIQCSFSIINVLGNPLMLIRAELLFDYPLIFFVVGIKISWDRFVSIMASIRILIKV